MLEAGSDAMHEAFGPTKEAKAAPDLQDQISRTVPTDPWTELQQPLSDGLESLGFDPCFVRNEVQVMGQRERTCAAQPRMYAGLNRSAGALHDLMAMRIDRGDSMVLGLGPQAQECLVEDESWTMKGCPLHGVADSMPGVRAGPTPG